MKIIPTLLGLETTIDEMYGYAQTQSLLRLGLKVNSPNKCNWRCPYCYVEKETSEDTLAYDAYNDAEFGSKTIRRLSKALEYGLKSITINGTLEPLMAPHLKQIIEFCSESGIYVTVVTNAALLNKEWIDFFIYHSVSILTKLNVPILDKGHPDFLRACKIQKQLSGLYGNSTDIYLKQLQQINLLVDSGFNELRKDGKTRLGIETVITKSNIDLIPHLVRQCREQNIYSHVELMKIQGDCNTFVSEQVSKIELDQLFQTILDEDVHDGFEAWIPKPPYVAGTCYQNLMRLDLHVDGDCYPCPGINLSVGNMDSQSLESILNNSYLNIIRNLEQYIQGDCKSCELFKTRKCYGGCRGTVYQTLIKKGFSTYDALVASDPSCKRVHMILDDGSECSVFEGENLYE